MLFRDLPEDDCDLCPLLKAEICPGGVVAGYGGVPIEPPCTMFEDDEDLDAWVENHFIAQRRREEMEAEQIRKQKEKDRKNEITRKRRQYTNGYCRKELIRANQLKKQIVALEKRKSLAESFVFATNITNEAFRMDERVSVNPAFDEKIKQLQADLETAEEILKNKRKESRNSEGYKQIK